LATIHRLLSAVLQVVPVSYNLMMLDNLMMMLDNLMMKEVMMRDDEKI